MEAKASRAKIASAGTITYSRALPGAPASLPTAAPVYDSRPSQPPRAMTAATSGLALPPGYSERQPPLSSTIAQYFLLHDLDSQRALSQWSVRTGFSVAGTTSAVVLAYRPYLLAQVSARYQDRRTTVYTARQYAYMIPEIDRAGFIQWDQHEVQPFDLNRLAPEPPAPAIFGDVPPGMSDPKRYTALRREVTDLVYSSKPLRVPFVPELDLYGDPAGDFGEFRARAQQVARERRDAETDALTQKFEKIINRIEQEEERKLQRLKAEKRELSNLKREQLFTTGEAVLSLLRGRTAYTLSRMSRSGVYKERSQGQLQSYELDLEQLEEEKQQTVDQYQAEVQRLNEKWAKAATNVQEHLITAFKKDINLDVIGVGWKPFWYAVVSGQPVLLPALQG
ncbi:MAG: hypothetical protein HUU31_22045 [Anaerolineae bacterium]|nr:hypothetical protein [Anaerolineae bacterium]